MKKNLLFTLAVFVGAATVASARAQQPSGVPVHVVVTVEAHKGKEFPVINREDVLVHEGRDRDPVVDWRQGCSLPVVRVLRELRLKNGGSDGTRNRGLLRDRSEVLMRASTRTHQLKTTGEKFRMRFLSC
jgi:hypothetical protein